MKISALRLFNVKRFAGRGVAIEGIGDGVNVLCAENEFGKSTSFEALHAVFFQPHTGTPGEVQRLRPYSGGNPLVEVDIATGDGAFRVTKQFYGGRSARVTDLASGRLIAQADEAENLIAGLIRGGSAGPAGLLWVRQGITGIEKRSRSEEDGEKQVRASLLESVQGEVEAVTGGRRMAEIMAAISDELAELVTVTGRPKAGGRYAAAIEERDRLTAEERRLGAEVASLRAALDKRSGMVRRLEELDNPGDGLERRQAVERAQAALDVAKAQGEALKAAEAELKLVRGQQEAAARDLKSFIEAFARAKELHSRLLVAEQQRLASAARRREVAEIIEKATTHAETVENEERDARNLLSRLDAALRAREAAEHQAELVQRLADAEAARASLEKAEAEFALLKLPAKAIDELQAVEIEIATLRAVEAAARPSVLVAYEGEAVTPMTLDGRALPDGEERAYDGHAQLAIPGIGVVTLRSSRADRGDGRRLAQAEEKRSALLGGMGVSDLEAARKRQVQAQQKDAELREFRSRLSTLAPQGLPKLREEVASRVAAGGDILELKEDPAQVRTALAAVELRRVEARHALREVQPLRASAEDAFVASETSAASLKAELAHVDAILGPESERGERERALTKSLADHDAALDVAVAREAKLRSTSSDLDSVEAALRRARSVDEAAAKEANALREAIAGLNGQIRRDSDGAIEEEWSEAIEALAAAESRVAAFEREVAVGQRLRTALETARSDARDLYLKPVMTELRPLLGLLFEDVSITFDEKTLLPQTILRNGQEEDVERLSGGMREQLSVLTRLAFARLLARDGRSAPVILDDALVYSDDDRIERMFDALHRQSRDQQIIVFSCRQRAFAKLGGNVLRMTEWHP